VTGTRDAGSKEKRVSFESSNITGVRVHRIHADGAMAAPSLSTHDEFVVGKIPPLHLTPNKT
jgi:hypothetical protein